MKPKYKIVKKTYLLPENLIKKTKKLFNTKTETEALIKMMERIVLQAELLAWDKKHAGKMKIRDLYGR